MQNVFQIAEFVGRDVSCRRGGREVIAGLSFRIQSGEALILRGANGSGKTTLLRLMAGLTPTTNGQLLWNGDDVREDLSAHGQRLAFAGHLDAIKSAQTVRENLAFWSELRGNTQQSAGEALKLFGLGHLASLPGRVLSAGQRHRLALARLTVCRAPLWLLDEPTNTLDDAALKVLRSVIETHLSAGGMAVIATHGDAVVPQGRVLDVRPGPKAAP